MAKYLDMIGWDDAPHLKPPNIAPEELDELEASLLPHQRQARRTGKPALGAGAIYPVEEDDLLCDPFVIPPHWPRGYGFDVGWNKTAALWGAHDPDADCYYLIHEYYRGEAEPVVHAAAIKKVSEWQTGAIDPAANQRNQKDGTKLMQEYKAEGLRLIKANNAVSAGIHHCLTLMQKGQLRVFRTLSNFRKEFRLYRRDEKGKIVKENDHLMDDMRYLLNTTTVFKTKPVDRPHRSVRGEFGKRR